jgi:hypothetical protein
VDRNTKIGIGAGAAFALLGALGSITSNWWAYGPIMAGCAFVAAWGLWPEKGTLHLPLLSGRYVALEEAALRIYEEDEEKSIEWSMAASGAVSPEAKLTHFKYVLLTLDDVTLYGVQPPSTKMREIPRDERRHLHPVDDVANGLADGGSRKARYINVSIRRKDLRKAINTYLAAANAMAEMDRKRGRTQ